MGGNEHPDSIGVAMEGHVRLPSGDRYCLEVGGAVDHDGPGRCPKPQIPLAEQERGDVEIGDSVQLAAQVVPFCG